MVNYSEFRRKKIVSFSRNIFNQSVCRETSFSRHVLRAVCDKCRESRVANLAMDDRLDITHWITRSRLPRLFKIEVHRIARASVCRETSFSKHVLRAVCDKCRESRVANLAMDDRLDITHWITRSCLPRLFKIEVHRFARTSVCRETSFSKHVRIFLQHSE